jgi:poly-gamma-glutamate synthesis protein (capsule biosynthesis protein)
MGLANNHALDFGSLALRDSATRLLREGIQPVGIQTPARNAYDATFFELSDRKKISLLAISDIGHGSEIATASRRAELKSAIGNARSHSDLTVCFVHWGIENSKRVTDKQRELARWLIDRGVDLVVGSHPHCVQPLDFYHGRPIAYSLGNLVFDGAPTIAAWNRGALLEVGLNEDAEISSVSLIPVVLEDGLPKLIVAQASGLR